MASASAAAAATEAPNGQSTKALHGFDVQPLCDSILSKPQDPKLPFISVGSGNGYLESHLRDSKQISSLICVDPKPESYAKYIPNHSFAPNFADIKELDASLIGKCNLILIWPSPNASTYDHDAIQYLSFCCTNHWVPPDPQSCISGCKCVLISDFLF
jgi:hypothetical protein